MFALTLTADLKAMLQKLAIAYASGRLEIEHNGERIKYVDKKDMRIVGEEIKKELIRRGALALDGEEQAEKPARVLYVFQTGNV